MKALRLTLAAIAATTIFSADAGWLDTTHDFGAFDEDLGAVECTFRYVNDTDEEISIVAARASCGCTTPIYPREAIAPGDTADVIVRFDPAGRTGRFSKYVAVDMMPEQPKVKLMIKGTVVGSSASVSQRFPVDADSVLKISRNAALFGQMKKGSTRTASIELYNRSTDTIAPTLDGLPKYITANIEPKTLAPGEQAIAMFYFNSGRCPLYGLVCDSLRLASGVGEPFLLETTAIVEEDFSKLSEKDLKKAPRVSIEDTMLDFGLIDGHETRTMTCTVKNTGKKPLLVRRLYTADPGVQLNIDKTTIKPGKTATITVEVDPDALKGGIFNARAILITNAPDSPTTTLRLVGSLPRLPQVIF